ncbi:MAG: hypothetical protein ACE5J4_03615 [Candidatus Aenigmatarchaeota archaeon]
MGWTCPNCGRWNKEKNDYCICGEPKPLMRKRLLAGPRSLIGRILGRRLERISPEAVESARKAETRVKRIPPEIRKRTKEFYLKKYGKYRKIAREEYPEEFRHMERRMRAPTRLRRVRGRIAKVGLASRIFTGNLKFKVETEIIKIAIMWIIGAVAIYFGFQLLGAGIIIYSFYTLLPTEEEILEDAMGPKKKEEERKKRKEELEEEKLRLEIERLRKGFE